MRCVACGEETGSRFRRWCSNSCFYLEDGYPDDSEEETDDRDEDEE